MRYNYQKPIVVKCRNFYRTHHERPYIRKDDPDVSIEFDHGTGHIVVMKFGDEIARFTSKDAPDVVLNMAARKIAEERKESAARVQANRDARVRLEVLDHFDELTSQFENFENYFEFDKGNRKSRRDYPEGYFDS